MSDVPAKPLMLRFPVREQIAFAKRLAMLLRSGMPLREGLVMLDMKHGSRSAAFIFSTVIDGVSHGKALSVAMAEFSSVFGTLSINMIKVGESSGTLHHNLAYLAEELKKKDALHKKVIGALMYPAVIVAATVGISTVLTVFIFPKIIPIFQSFKHRLPLSTRILIALSSFLLKDGIWLLIALIAAVISIFLLLRSVRVKGVADRLILYLPLFGTLTRYYNLATCTRTISLLLKGDVRIVAAIDIVRDSTHNTVYQEALRTISSAVGRGQKLSLQLQAYPTLFPTLCTQMIAVAEETGDLAGSLMYISDMYEEEINDLTKNLTTLLEPVLMIVMGVIVGFIAISIITPIYGITQDLTPH
jgi:type II secretory pathway component PulF